MEDDPKKPYKALVAAIVAGGSVALVHGTDIMSDWLWLIVAVIVGGLATYLTPNPKIHRPIVEVPPHDPVV